MATLSTCGKPVPEKRAGGRAFPWSAPLLNSMLGTRSCMRSSRTWTSSSTSSRAVPPGPALVACLFGSLPPGKPYLYHCLLFDLLFSKRQSIRGGGAAKRALLETKPEIERALKKWKGKLPTRQEFPRPGYP